MIKIERAHCPLSLSKDCSLFRENDYKNSEVKDKLLAMQHYKCCYCERPLRDTPDTECEVEHYFPRSHFKDSQGNIQWCKANNWNNLLISCRKCNLAKSNKIPVNSSDEILIINPTDNSIDPEDHIGFEWDIEMEYIAYKEQDESSEGKLTIENLQLRSRIDLFKNLRLVINDIDRAFKNLLNAMISRDEAKIQELKRCISVFMSAHSPYASFQRKYIKYRVHKFNSNIIPCHFITYEQLQITFPTGYQIVT